MSLLIRTLEGERHGELSGRGRVSDDASSSTLVERVGAGSAEETSGCTSQLGSRIERRIENDGFPQESHEIDRGDRQGFVRRIFEEVKSAAECERARTKLV